jgi:hypothetical protein
MAKCFQALPSSQLNMWFPFFAFRSESATPRRQGLLEEDSAQMQSSFPSTASVRS